MKNISLIVWITQLGLSVVLPPVIFIFLACWLHNSLGWGKWVLWIGIAMGVYGGIMGLVSSLRTISHLADSDKKEKRPPSFNDHS